MGIPRRQFLKGLWQSWQVGALGLLGTSLSSLSKQGVPEAWAAPSGSYAQRLPQGLSQGLSKSLRRSPGRKLALLIGVNNYENSPLKGCLTDIALQEQLLIHRFGFAASDVLTLTDGAATARNIAQAVTEHLIAQALPGDLVVWHFSGYGTRCNGKDALLPVDETELISLDLVRHWLKSIAAHQVIGVIDAGFYSPSNPGNGLAGTSGANTMGNIGHTLVRAKPSQSSMKLMTEDQLNAPVPGLNLGGGQLEESQVCLLMATAADQLCLDINPAGFSCGAFTYALTQSLWELANPITDRQLVSDLAQRLAESSDSLPVVQWLAGSSPISSEPSERLLPFVPQGDGVGAGVILGDTKNRDTFDLWLMDLPPHALANYDSGSILRIMTTKRTNEVIAPEVDWLNDYWLGLQSRHGLVGKVELLHPEPLVPMVPKIVSENISEIAAGDLVHEQIRVLPRQVALYVALDNSLNKIERIDATSALSAQPNLGPLLQPLNTGSDQPPDCIFSLQAISYGILALNRQPLVGSFGSVGESVGVAIKRLSASFAELLAAKLLRLTENAASSQISVQASLYSLGSDLKSEAAKSVKPNGWRRLISTRSTHQFRQKSLSNPQQQGQISIDQNPIDLVDQIDLGDRLECRISNGEPTPLYAELFYIDSRGRLLNRTGANQNPSSSYEIPPHQTLVLPQAALTQAPFSWSVTAPKGRVEVLVMISRAPFANGRAVLTNDSTSANNLNNALTNTIYPLRLAEGVLLDLHQQSLGHQEHFPETIRKTINSYLPSDDHHWILDMHQWATLTLSYYVA